MNNASWWAAKLNPQTSPQMPPLIPPSQQPMAAMPTFQPQPPQSKAQSAKQVATCPECGSGNYMAPSPQIAPRCYDCGYPVQQSGSHYGSLTGAVVEGSAKAAHGNDTQSNWNPQGIIGRIN
jgi:ribosomal protein S27AE